MLFVIALVLSGCWSTPGSAPSPSPQPAGLAAATPAGTGIAEPIASTAAIPTSQLPVVEFVRRDGSRVSLPVEVLPRSEYSVGLSGRSEVSGRGMLFYFGPDEANPGFWMKDTHIDLSIAFVAPDGVVIDVRDLQAESLEIVMPNAHYQYAVEAPAGWYAANNVRAGDIMALRFTLPANIMD